MVDKDNIHESVLKHEVIEHLHIKKDGVYIDCTLGRAGHAQEIAGKLTDQGLIIGFDQDITAIQSGEKLLPDNRLLIHSNFRNLQSALQEHHIEHVDGILLDLGVSSPQLDQKQRGFSYQQDAPLDMRMDIRQGLTAKKVVNEWAYEDLVRIFYVYGEEKFSKNIARTIEREREIKPIETTFDLVDIIKQAIPAPARRKGGHPAKRIFQAIRIAVNDELESFIDVLNQAAQVLSVNGYIAVITFHSLEDRICKRAFKKWSTEKPVPRGVPIIPEGYEAPFKLITRKPIIPTEEEIALNRRARSAKLRVVQKVKPWDTSFSYEEGRKNK